MLGFCAAISGEISILIQTGQSLGEGFLYQESAVGTVHVNATVGFSENLFLAMQCHCARDK